MAKVYEVFEHDIKRKFDDVMTVEDSDAIKAIDIDEYVLTQNVEDILGNFVAYFFDDKKEFPALQMKTQLLQDTYRDRIGPGVWIRGFFGAGKSHLLKVIYTISPLSDEKAITFSGATNGCEDIAWRFFLRSVALSLSIFVATTTYGSSAALKNSSIISSSLVGPTLLSMS